MEDLRDVLQIIDRYTDKISDGDYLELCDKLKRAYNKKSDPEHLFDYQNFSIPPIGSDEQTTIYFYDYFYERALDLDLDFLGGQMDYLHGEYEKHKPLKRCSPRIREQVKEHFCNIQDVDRSQLDETLLDTKNFNYTCKVFMQLENNFRWKYREAIERRIRLLESCQDNLAEIWYLSQNEPKWVYFLWKYNSVTRFQYGVSQIPNAICRWYLPHYPRWDLFGNV